MIILASCYPICFKISINYLEHIIYLLSYYKYLILLPLAIVEGPIIAVVVGLLCSKGFLNPLYAYVIIVFGDLIGDSIVYMLGRWGKSKFLKKTSNWLGFTDAKMARARIFFEANPNKTISLSKIILGVGVAGIFMAGNAKVAYNKFIGICLVTSALQYIVYISIGFLFGQAYIQINHYLNYFASLSVLVAIAIIVFFFIKSKLKKI
ncbi:DedA family protein [Ferruginibacter sp.]|uniref:DedA family protein n=1 Tax=Ferruginibacter sp. TaxID=1940288 RepID=UPI001984CC3D|nr:DedA family protein [Ferruginibacter sp.]MBC7626251.1 DedA family protein [Ferruginibacter sp.]